MTVASRGSQTSSSSSVNSSPLSRATVSFGRSAASSRRATACSSWSPVCVAERVVDDLEAVEVEEQHRGAALGVVALGAADRLVEAVDEQHAVGQAGERVVQRVVLQAPLGLAAVGDVGERADDAGRAAVLVAHRDAAREHPAVGAVAVLHPVLELEVVVRAVGQVRVERLRERRAVVGVHAAEPLPARLADLVLAVAEHGLPAGGVEDAVLGDVPVPDAVVGALQRERVALLGLGELLERALVRDRVADRVLEPVGAQPGDEQEVGDAGLRGLLVGGASAACESTITGICGTALHELLGQQQPVRARAGRSRGPRARCRARASSAPRSACSGVRTCSTCEPRSSARTGAWRASSAETARTRSG